MNDNHSRAMEAGLAAVRDMDEAQLCLFPSLPEQMRPGVPIVVAMDGEGFEVWYMDPMTGHISGAI